MEKTIHNVFTFLVMLALIVSSCLWTGCSMTGKPSLLGSVKQVIVGDDYEAAGRAVGEASQFAYVILKDNPKYDKYTSKYKEFCDALDNSESETVKIGTLNQVALDIMTVAMTAKYGYPKAQIIVAGTRVGGAIIDRILAKKIDNVAVDKFLNGFNEGRKEASDAALPVVVTDASEVPNYITCKNGSKCMFTFTNRSTAVQLAIAKELYNYGFLDKSAVRKDPYVPTDAENVVDFIGLCEKMLELGVDKMKVWIAEVRINEDGKLESIKFLYEDFDGEIKETNCATCVM